MAGLAKKIGSLHDAVGLSSDYLWSMYSLIEPWRDYIKEGPISQLARIRDSRGASPPPATSGKRVLIVSLKAGNPQVMWEAVAAWAMEAAGHEVEVLSCGEGMHFCDWYMAEDAPGITCGLCRESIRAQWKATGLKHRLFRDVCPESTAIEQQARRAVAGFDAAACLGYTVGDIEVGRLCLQSVLRSSRIGTVRDDERTLTTYRHYIAAGCGALAVAERVLAEQWDLVMVLNGYFSTEAIFDAVAKQRGIPVLTWERGFQRNTLTFSLVEPIMDFSVAKPFATMADVALSAVEEAELQEIETIRRSGKGCVYDLFPKLDEADAAVLGAAGIDPARPFDVLFSNIVWDTAVIGRELAFDSMYAWVAATIRHYMNRDDRQLVIRLHPAEVVLPMKSLERVGDLIARDFGDKIEGVGIVPSESGASSYTLLNHARRAIVYTSTLGMEAAMQGKEVVTAAITHYRGLGFSIDPATREDYLAALDREPVALTPAQRTRARRYAHLFFRGLCRNLRSIEETAPGEAVIVPRTHRELVESRECEVVRYFRDELFPLKVGKQIRRDYVPGGAALG